MDKEKTQIIHIDNNSGGYNLAEDTLVFGSNIGLIGMDLRSALEVAYTLIDCLHLDYYTNTVEDAEMAIVDREEGVSK